MALQGFFETNWLQIALKITLTVVIVLVVVGLCYLLVARLRRLLLYKGQKQHKIFLKNQGNVRSVFHLMAKSVDPLLKFQFEVNQTPLAEIIEEVELPATVFKQPFAQSKVNQNVKVTAEQNVTPNAPGNTNPVLAAQGTNKALKTAVAKTGAVASLLGVIGGLLPGSLGKQIKAQGAAVRGVQTKSKNIMEKPQGLQNRFGQMQKDSGKLGVKIPAPQSPNNNPTVPANTSQVVQNQQFSMDLPVPTLRPALQTVKYFRTGAVEPGDSLLVTLDIGSNKRVFPEGSFLYTVKSQQVPLEKFDKEISPLSKEGTVHFSHVGRWRYWLPDLLSVLLIVVSLLMIAYFISLVWG